MLNTGSFLINLLLSDVSMQISNVPFMLNDSSNVTSDVIRKIRSSHNNLVKGFVYLHKNVGKFTSKGCVKKNKAFRNFEML